MIHTAYNQPGGKGLILDRGKAATNRVWFVQSTHAKASDSAGYGRHPDLPFATLDYLLTNYSTLGVSSYDIVVVGPGHNEGLANDQWAFAIADLTIVAHELAVGGLAPIFDFDHANTSIDITANNMTLVGLKFRPSITDVLIGVEIATDVTGTRLIGCEFMCGEDGAGVDDFAVCLKLVSGNHDTVIRGNRFLSHVSAAGYTHAVSIAAASNRLVIENNVIYGQFATGGIVEAAAGTEHVFRGNNITTTGTNISFHGSSTFAARLGGGGGAGGAGNVDAAAVEDVAGNLIGRNDNDNAADTTQVAANDDGSVLEREEALKDYVKTLFSAAAGTGVYPTGVTSDSILAMLMSKAATAAASSYNNTTDSLEAISDALAAGTGATTALEADHLDHLMAAADGTGAYPASAANDSVVSMILAKGATATASTYDNTTDSLEAISDALAAGTGATTALEADHIDHLMAAADGTGAYPASAANDSVVSMILSKDNPAAASSYDNTTDSLEAISDQAAKIDGAALGTVVAGSATAVVERCCEKSDGAVLAGADDLFTIAGGPVLAQIYGIVTTLIGGAATCKLQITTTTPAATVDLNAGAVAIDNDAAGTSYYNVGATSVFTPVTAGIVLLDPVTVEPTWMLLPIGTVKAFCSGAQDGNIKWYMRYKPLSPNSLVTAAA
jgi:hypothetical protein